MSPQLKRHKEVPVTRIKVVQDKDRPVATETLAEAVVRIGEASEALKKSGLNEEAIVVLLSAKTGIGKSDIRVVLNGMRQLRAWYCRP